MLLVMKDEWSCTAASSPPTTAYSPPTPPFLPSESAVVMSLIFCSFLSLSIIYRLGKLRHTVRVWRSGELQQHCKWVLIILQITWRAKEQEGRSLPLKVARSGIGWVSHTAVEYKCRISGIGEEWLRGQSCYGASCGGGWIQLVWQLLHLRYWKVVNVYEPRKCPRSVARKENTTPPSLTGFQVLGNNWVSFCFSQLAFSTTPRQRT